jgi:hypothetical protein
LSAKDRTRKKNSIDKHGDAFETTYAREKREGGNDGTVDHRRNFDGFNDFSLLVFFFFVFLKRRLRSITPGYSMAAPDI